MDCSRSILKSGVIPLAKNIRWISTTEKPPNTQHHCLAFRVLEDTELVYAQRFNILNSLLGTHIIIMSYQNP